MPDAPPRSPGLYLHIPFCSAICPYCDFAVTTGDADRRSRFIETLVTEIGLVGPEWSAFDTIYLGGGTPSALGAPAIERVLAAIRERLPLAGTHHVTLEANPEDVDETVARRWREIGIDRLSLGVQSFSANGLAFLGRRHSAEEAAGAVEAALAAGLAVSLDLIYGLPGQDVDAWQLDLARAVQTRPHHVSCYQLTIESGTPFAVRSRRGDWKTPEDDTLAEMLFRAHEFLAESGFEAYEVASFARSPADRSRHNKKYWRHVPYLGLGPSAHSFDGRRRWWNHRSEPAWRLEIEAGRLPVAGREDLTVVDRALEMVMLGLRTPRGVDLGSLAGIQTAAFLERNADFLARAADGGLLEIRGRFLVPSLAGMAQADALARGLRI